jgi:hypothetical protein
MNNSDGIKYFYEEFLGLNQSNVFFGSDFLSGGSFPNYLENAAWLTGSLFLGDLNGDVSNFYANNGTGYFNGGNSVEILGNVPKERYGFFFSCEKNLDKNVILLSSAFGSSFAQNSGVTLGINDAHFLYLEYWNPVEGKFSLTIPERIGSKNLFFLKKDYSNFEFGFFDAELRSSFYASIDAQDEKYAHSNRFFLGKSNSTFSTGNALVGSFDAFYGFSGLNVSSQEIGSIFSGFYSFPYSGSATGVYQECTTGTILSGSGIVIGTGITGYEEVTTYTTGLVPTGYHQSGYIYYDGYGISGYERTYQGTQTDYCGYVHDVWRNIPLYGDIYKSGTTGVYSGFQEVVTEEIVRVPLTGEITGEVNVPVEVVECVDVTGYSSGGFNYDYFFLRSLGLDGVYSFFPNGGGELSPKECFLATGNNCFSQDINLRALYDGVSGGFKIDPAFVGERKNLFFSNGQLLYEDGWSSYLSGYQTIYDVSGNVFLDSYLVRSQSGTYLQSTDSVIHDHSSSMDMEQVEIVSQLPAGTSISSVFSSSAANCSIFLNGQKLISGIDFNSSFLIEIPSESVLIKVSNEYICDDYLYLTGLGNRFISPNKFMRGTSILYTNGLRQEISKNYDEISKYSILSGVLIDSSISNKRQVLFEGLESNWGI